MSMTIEEIAKQANVSKAAVSLALNNRPGVGPDTRARILEIVKQSGYKHRSMVDSNKQNQPSPTGAPTFRVVGCMKGDEVSPQYQSSSFFSDVMRSIEKYSRKAGYSMAFSYLESSEYVQEMQSLESTYPSAGIIFLGTNLESPEVRELVAHFPRCVIIDTIFEHLDADFVVMDNVMGGFSAAMHLVTQLGHTSVGYAEAHQRIPNFEKRKQGFFEALGMLGMSISPSHRYRLASDIHQAKRDFSPIAADLNSLPTAIFCECDYIAIGIMQALQEAGVPVPERVSVIGFDNVPEASIVNPPLTTISVSRDKIGELAVKHLIQMKENPGTQYIKTLVNTSLVPRSSCTSAS